MADAPIGGSGQDLVTVNSNGVKYLGQLVVLLRQLFPRIFGTFTLTAAASHAVADPRVQAGATVQLQAANAAAGTLQGSAKSLYYTVTPGVGFTVFTANATNAAGGEVFSYTASNPV